MCTPDTSVSMNITSASSALHMEPESIPIEERADGACYLVEVDLWAQHSYEHMSAALRGINAVKKALDDEILKLIRAGVDFSLTEGLWDLKKLM